MTEKKKEPEQPEPQVEEEKAKPDAGQKKYDGGPIPKK